MNPSPPQTSLNTSADAIVIGLKASQGLVGAALAPTTIVLNSDDGKFSLRVPASAFPHLHPEPGEVVIVSITLMLNRIEAVDPFAAQLIGGKAQ